MGCALNRTTQPVNLVKEQPQYTIRAVIVGPSGTGKGTQCEKLQQFDIPTINTGQLLLQESQKQTERGKLVNQLTSQGKLVPDEIVCEVVLENINLQKNFTLCGFPRTLKQAQWLIDRVEITHFIVFVCDEKQTIARLKDRLYDPTTKKTYHRVENPPPLSVAKRCIQRDDDKEEVVKQRIIEFQQNISEVKTIFPFISYINTTDKTISETFTEISKLMKLSQNQKSFHAIIIGPPGVGKGTQCERLKREYNATHLSSGVLIKKELKDTDAGAYMQQYIEQGQLVPDANVCKIIQKQLNKLGESDSWVLDGFPRTVEQAKWIYKQGIDLTDVIELVGDEKEIKERLIGRVIDPETMVAYHLITNPPPESIAERCMRREDDAPDCIEKRFQEFYQDLAVIKSVYQGQVKMIDTTNKSMDDVFKEIKHQMKLF